MSTREFFRRHVFHNVTLKITSLLLAIGLWLAVASSPPSEVVLNTAIIFRNMPADLEISSETIPSVQIRVRGPERVVSRLDSKDVRAELDLVGIHPGEHTFDLTKAITVPDRLEVSQVVPSEVHVLLDVRDTRLVPVRPRIVGASAAMYHATSDPAQVAIIGPRKEVEAVESAITDPVDVTGIRDSLVVTRPAYVPDPLVQVKDSQPVRVTVTIQKDQSSPQSKPE